MPRDYDDDDYDDEDDDDADIPEDDREADYYEHMWGGPEDEELEAWYDSQDEDEDQEHDYCFEDFDPFALPLPTPQPGDEAAAREHFAALKRKYKAESISDTSPLSPLYKILLKLESGEKLDDDDLSWLRKNRVRGPIRFFATRAAVECEERFKASRDGWEAVKASSF